MNPDHEILDAELLAVWADQIADELDTETDWPSIRWACFAFTEIADDLRDEARRLTLEAEDRIYGEGI